MSRSATGSSLRKAVAGSAIIMTAFGSAASSQQAQTPPSSWHGTFEWKHFCQGGGSTDETRGVGKLQLYYSASGTLIPANRPLTADSPRPDLTLYGTLNGTIPERSQTIPPCSFTFVAPGTFSANVAGSYMPAQNTFSAYAYRVNSTPGRASFACPQAPANEVDQAYFTVYEGPMFEDAFRELRRHPGGGWKANGERTVSVGQSTCTTTYALALYGCGENMPERGIIYVGPGVMTKLYSAPSTDSTVLTSLYVGMRVRYTQKKQASGQTWYFVVHFNQRGWARASDFSCGEPIRPPVKRPPLSPEDREALDSLGKARMKPALTSAGRG